MNNEILITGGTGRLGRALAVHFPSALAPSRSEMDVGSAASVEALVGAFKPQLVIHLAAMTDVVACEKRREEAWRCNVEGTLNLLASCRRHAPACRFVQMSTPCVFDGERGDYTEDDIPRPSNFYGLTKLSAETAVAASGLERTLIVRANFVPRSPWPYPAAFTDRWGTYLFADDAALAIFRAVEEGRAGILHVAGEDKLSMFDLAKLTTPGVRPLTLEEWSARGGAALTRDMSLVTVRPGWPRFRLGEAQARRSS